MARLLISGGAGFIGCNFVHYWLHEHPTDRVVVLDALTYAGRRTSLREAEACSAFRFVHGDICDQALVQDLLRSERLDTIVHFAAESHVDRSIVGPDAFIQTNVLGTHSLLKAARTVWLEERSVPRHRFHHVSTDEVYGSLGPADAAFCEATAYAPNSPYSASKACSDHLVRAYHHTYGLSTSVTNCSNNYGPYHFPEKLVPLSIVNILEGRALAVYGTGANIRDWLYVEDHCRAVDAVLTRGRPGEVYNVGGRSECDNITVVRKLCAIADEYFESDPTLARRFANASPSRGKSCAQSIRFVADRPGHDFRYAVDCSKLQRELGVSPSVGLDAGLRRTFSWYLENEPWWRSILDGRHRAWMQRQYGQQA